MEETILKLQQVTKVYGNGVVANRDVNVDFQKGEIHSICGENDFRYRKTIKWNNYL